MTLRRRRARVVHALRVVGAVAASLLIAACASRQVGHVRPKFPPPRNGVFQDPVPLVETTDDDLLPTLTPAGDLVAYAADSGGNLDIFVRPTSGGAAQRLTTHSTDDTEPAFSPDGRRLAWVSQAEDVKGDVWVMDKDGSNKRRLTDRTTHDRAPSWSGDGRTIYFNSLAEGTLTQRVDAIEIDSGLRTTVVERGWDASASPDGTVLFFVGRGDAGRSRIFAKRLGDGRVAAITDGAYLEGMPRAVRYRDGIEVLFTRFVDDTNGDAIADADDSPSLWRVHFDPRVFDGAPVATARPLTAGANSEIFANASGDWLVYTASGDADLDVYALPLSGMINADAAATAVLEAARAEDNPMLRRVALRYLVASAPALEADARYELARELSERNKLADAIDELGRVMTVAGDTPLAAVAAIEAERLRFLQRLRGKLVVREDAERDFLRARLTEIEKIARAHTDSTRVQVRARTARAEADYALGKRKEAVATFEHIGRDKSSGSEDAARSLLRLAQIYSTMGEAEAVGRVAEQLLAHHPTERFAGRQAAELWVQAAQGNVGLSPLAALEKITSAHGDLAPVAARAALALASLQVGAVGGEGAAIERWRDIVSRYPNERQVVAQALLQLGAAAERNSRPDDALDAYERILADFGSDPELRSRARRGLVRLALETARVEEAKGERDKARQSYLRLLRNDRELVIAHRRYIALSAAQGHLQEVLEAYRKAAADNPRDLFSRYGYGYALTFVTPVPLDDAEREIRAALDLDPRFAAAHLTLGWIFEQRERQQRGAGWLEEAARSYEVAKGLVDPNADAELWAAANLNHGNALFALGTDPSRAFDAYLTRELCPAPYDNPLTELLFRESFARVALRVEAFDVAIDMAKLAHDLSRHLPGHPRRAATAALLAAIYLQTGTFDEAERWYEEARQLYAARRDWARVVPLLRGRALAQQAQGREDAALSSWRDLLAILKAGDGPPDPPHSILVTEVPIDANNVTRAVYGFSSPQEEELARTLTARLLRQRQHIDAARRLDRRRLQLLREASENGTEGPRIRYELLVALNESALLATRADALDEAQNRFQEALSIASELQAWSELATILGSLQSLWTRAPNQTNPQVHEAALAAAVAAREEIGDKARPEAQKLARFLALEHLRIARTPPPPGSSFANNLARLDDLAGQAALADELAQSSGDMLLARHLTNAYGSGQLGMVASDSQEPPAAQEDKWRQLFDGSLWQKEHPDEQLDEAIAAFEKAARPDAEPERGAFLDLAARSLEATGDNTRAWHLLERARLLELLPPAQSARARPQGSNPDLQAALAAKPASLEAVQKGMGDGALLQVFAPLPSRWHWFLVTPKALYCWQTSPTQDGLPDPVAHAVAELQQGTRLWVDGGEVLALSAARLQLSGHPLGTRFQVVEALSATYLLAAREERALSRAPTAVLAASEDPPAQALVELEPRARLLHLQLPGTMQPGGGLRAGVAQVIFAAPGAPRDKGSIDLDGLAARGLKPAVALVDRVPSNTRAQRAVAQALLIGGAPTVIVGSYSGDSALLQQHLESGIEEQAAVSVLADSGDAKTDSLRIFGDGGMSATGRLDFALTELMRLARAAAGAFKAARADKSLAAWRRAREPFVALLDVVEFLRSADNAPRIAASKNATLKKIVPALGKVELENRANLANVHLAISVALAKLPDASAKKEADQEIDRAAKLWGKIIAALEPKGDTEKIAENTLALGRTLSLGSRPKEAAGAFKRCIDLAKAAKSAEQQADCSSRLGSELRALFDYKGAERAYMEALLLYAKLGSANELYPRRYLGFLYESAFNNYDKALEQFRAALDVARRKKQTALVPSLLLDVARVFRLRGDYEQALQEVKEASAAKLGDDSQVSAEAALEAAKIHWYRGNYRRALERQREGLELARRFANDFLEIQALSLDGLIALNQGELTRAERSIEQALDLSRMTRRKSEEAVQLNNLGIVLRDSGRAEEAVQRFREALAIDEELGSSEGRAYDLRNLAVALKRQGKVDEAKAALDQSLEISRQIGNRYNELQCLFAKGDLLEAQNANEARKNYAAAAELAEATAVAEVEWRSLYGLGRLAEQSGDTKAARDLFAKALSVAERLGRGRSESVSSHGRDDLYDDAIRLALADGDVAAAFLFVERARARGLLDVLATRTIDFANGEAKHLLEAELATREALLAAQRDLARGVEGAREAVAAASREHAHATATLSERYPRLARAFLIQPVAIDALQKLLPPGTLVLSYYVGAKATTVISVSRDASHAARIAIEQEALVATVKKLRGAMNVFAPVDQTLSSLGELLLPKEMQRSLEGANTLVLLPYGPLYHVPFAALPMANDVLAARLAVAEAPSASVLFDLLSKKRIASYGPAIALAPASDLPFARLEARAIGGTKAVLGPDASEGYLRKLRTDAIDLAAHGELDADDPLASAIVLAPDSGDDGRLEVREIFALDNAPPLVTLSACSSAAEVSGNAWLGLANAFFTAGSRTVVASQQRVADLSAAVLMKRFYRLQPTLSSAEALRQAALWTRRYFPHPSHWAGFVLLGDFR